MHVEDDLAAFATHVHRDPITGQRRVGGDALRREQQRPDQLLVAGTEIVQRRTVNFGDYEAMKRSLRVNVLERKQCLGLVDTARRYVARDDLAEQAIRIVVAHARPPGTDSISRRPRSARDSVPLSMYSSSPPTGTPYAIRLARTPCLWASAATRLAVASPSTVTLVARTTSAKPSCSKRRSSSSRPSSLGP